MSETKYKIIFITGIAIAVLLFFLITGDTTKDKNDNNIHAAIEPIEQESPTEEESASKYVVIDIKGEVMNPGVYEIEPDSRVNDVIHLAGGFTEDADTDMINLAQKVHDEMSIIVAKKGDADTEAVSLAGGVSNGKIRINYATQEEIETLNGIGPAKAQAIIQYREENGLFSQPEDLLDISGIGEKTLQNFIDQIQIP